MGGLILDGGSIQANGGLSFGGGTGEAVIYTTYQNGTISAKINAGNLTTGIGLTVFGPGILTLSRAAGNNITGVVNVNGGTLNITNTSGSATGSGTVNVNNGATLTGVGIISNGANGVTFGPAAGFAPGNGTSFGATTIVTTGTVATASPQTSPGNLTAAQARLRKRH